MNANRAQKYVQSLLDDETNIVDDYDRSVVQSLRTVLQSLDTTQLEMVNVENQKNALYNTQQQLVGEREAYLKLLVAAEESRRIKAQPGVAMGDLAKALKADKIELVPREGDALEADEVVPIEGAPDGGKE